MPKASKRTSKSNRSALVFEPKNYIWLVVSVLLITVGFTAMYIEGEFLGFVSLNVSPVLIVAGYAGVIYAILARPDDESEPAEASSEG